MIRLAVANARTGAGTIVLILLVRGQSYLFDWQQTYTAGKGRGLFLATDAGISRYGKI
jgi:hypothetical protein